MKDEMQKQIASLPPELREGFQDIIDLMPDDPELHPALKSWVYETAMGEYMKHPYVFMNLNPFSNPNKFYEQKRRIRRDYINGRNLHGMIFAVERPWRMNKLANMYRHYVISLDELRELLPGIWTDIEAPQAQQREPLELFRECKFVTDDPEGWEKLPENFKLYRGVDGTFELTADGPSWTLDLEIARFFGFRFGAAGTVYGYDASKSEALAYITGREEAEIILDWDYRSDPKSIYEVESHEPS